MNNIKSVKLGYLLWRFPVISETFILNEMLELKDSHKTIKLKVYSVKKPLDSKVHKRANDFIVRDTYCPGIFNPKIYLNFMSVCIKHPLLLISTVKRLFSNLPFNSISLFGHAFFQTIYCLIIGVYFSQIFRKNNFQFLHSHYAESSSLITMVAANLAGIPYSFTMHAHDIFKNRNKKLIINLIKNSKFCVTISDYNKKYLISLDQSIAEKIEIVHCGIDINRFKPNHATKIKKRKLKLLTVARLVETKGVREVIEACSILPADISIEYNIIGNGPQLQELQELIIDKKLQSTVKLLKEKTQDEILAYMGASDLFILLCNVGRDGNRDGIPVALMEAMAMELLVISTRVSGIPELIYKGTGFLIEENDVTNLAKTIVDIYQMNFNDKELMEKNARRIIKDEFNLKTEVSKLATLFLH